MMLSSLNKLTPYYLNQTNISRNNHVDNFNTDFKELLSKATSKTESVLSTSATETLVNDALDMDSYLAQLQAKFGSKISVQSMEYSKANINHIGGSTIGTGNVIVAPNILEKMASDPRQDSITSKKFKPILIRMEKQKLLWLCMAGELFRVVLLYTPMGK